MENLPKETLQKLFESMDKDKSGSLDRHEIKQVSTELGNPLNDAELDDLFNTVDIDRDGSISFKEFHTWLTCCKDKPGKINQLLKLALKAESVAKQTHDKLKFKQIEETASIDQHHIKVALGNFEPGISISIRGVSGGVEASQAFGAASKGLGLKETQPGAVLSLRAKNPEAAKAALQAFVEELVQVAGALIPEAEAFIPTTKFSFAVEGDRVKVGITSEHSLAKMLIEPYAIVQQTFIPNDQPVKLRVELNLATHFKALLESEASIIENLLGGVSLGVDIELRRILITKLRELIGSAMVSKIEKGKTVRVGLNVLSHLLQTSKFELNLRCPDDIKASLANQPQAQVSLKQVIEIAKGEGATAFIEQIPIAKDMIALFNQHFYADAELHALGPKTAVTVAFKTTGLAEVIDFLIAN
eukprot:TRINITY_DN508_c0_g2_i1.p1 TRINITY_DN508_c0_g2~~TRINITY_DN508_c0_g2_i1.p1  ORF type:complete len:416 (-),score=148.11 TRINITY_DN508_c0_g2_i1:120-1367(-)